MKVENYLYEAVFQISEFEKYIEKNEIYKNSVPPFLMGRNLYLLKNRLAKFKDTPDDSGILPAIETFSSLLRFYEAVVEYDFSKKNLPLQSTVETLHILHALYDGASEIYAKL